ncbi:MAG: hypothetical protein IK083_00700 [Abditibacteriota bacterium]|nr:hypothetical protein [Abditibacteriota bacterium]
MTNTHRILNTLRGLPVDRPPVNFYEIGGFNVDPGDPSPYNVYNSPDWQPLLQLAEEKTDVMRFGIIRATPRYPELHRELVTTETRDTGRSIITVTTFRIGGRTLTRTDRRDAEADTVWHTEHLLKNTEDLQTFLSIPDEYFLWDYDASPMTRQEEALGDRGVVMADGADALAEAAVLFSMEDYTVLALTEEALFRSLLDKLQPSQLDRYSQIAAQRPDTVWRLCGPEYATPPYLPPALFREYVVPYDKPLIDIIHGSGGLCRLHCHGKIKRVAPYILELGPDGIDPVEPPEQGDVTLAEARELLGPGIALFGNIEASDIETLRPADFAEKVRTAVEEGSAGPGGFALQPSASPYGRRIAPSVMENYMCMLQAVGAL